MYSLSPVKMAPMYLFAFIQSSKPEAASFIEPGEKHPTCSPAWAQVGVSRVSLASYFTQHGCRKWNFFYAKEWLMSVKEGCIFAFLFFCL